MKRIGAKIKRTQDAPFAVVDDIGVRSATEAFRSYVHAVINHRVTSGLPTVYTSNLPMSDMANVFDARLYDRIRDQDRKSTRLNSSQVASSYADFCLQTKHRST